MSPILPFDRLVRRVLKTDDGIPHIDVEALAREVKHYDRDVQERLRRAALRAIDEELVKIHAERTLTMSNDLDRPLGLQASCATCGGQNARTGRHRTAAEPISGLGDPPDGGERVRETEVRCSQCGRTVWFPEP
jgi:ribosomal protein L37E